MVRTDWVVGLKAHFDECFEQIIALSTLREAIPIITDAYIGFTPKSERSEQAPEG